MNYIVIDLEYNQPFNFSKGKKTLLNAGCPSEIIQIGAVKLDKNFKIMDYGNFYVRPQVYTRIHPYVEKLTGIDSRVLENGFPFEQAYRKFVKFTGFGKSVLCTWGPDDVKELYRNALFYGINHRRLTKSFINIQKLAGTYLGRTQNCIGLKTAVEALNISTPFSFHNALNDAIYTAEIFKLVKYGDMPVQKLDVEQLKEKISARVNALAQNNI